MTTTQLAPLSLKRKLYYLMISITLNTFGNALTVSMNMGSSMWTAGSVNVSRYLAVDLSWILMGNAILGILWNIWLDKEVDWKFIAGNIAFVLPFSTLVQMWVGIFAALGLPQLPWLARLLLDIGGIFLIAVAVSIYQRVNWIIHPLDEVTNTLRFRYCGGNPVKAQLLNFSVPISVMAVVFCLSGHLYAVNVGTIVVLLFQGAWIGWADKHVFSELPHYFRH